MLTFIGSAVSAGGTLALVTFNLEAWFVYGLVAWLIGLIAWSKYTEPALSPPYPVADPAAGAGLERAAVSTVPRSPASPGSPAADHEAM